MQNLLQQRTPHNFKFLILLRFAHFKSSPKPQPSPSPPSPKPPNPPKNPVSFTHHNHTWEDPYHWMSNISDKTSMRHMQMYLEQEEKYIEAVMSDTERLQQKLMTEMVSRMATNLCSTPIRWGPWLYYRRVEEGKQYPIYCRRLASLQEKFISFSSPSAGFDYMTGKKVEQILLDYNKEAERYGGFAYEELSEVSPDHRFLAYTMYDKDNDIFCLSVRDLSSRSLCSKPKADRVASMAWAKDGKALLYTVTDHLKRPYRIFCSVLGSNHDDVLLLDEPNKNVNIHIRHTKDFQFMTVNTFSDTFSKVYLINAVNPLSGMTLVWECELHAHCIVEHHQGYLYLFTDAAKEGQPVYSHYLLRCPVKASSTRNWEVVFLDETDFVIEDVDFNDTHLVLFIREGRKFKLCSVTLPLAYEKGAVSLRKLNPRFLPLPEHVSKILPGPNYDYYSKTMRFTISSPVMPDAVVDYELINGNWFIVQQQDVLHERSRALYGTSSSASNTEKVPTPESFYSTTEANCENERSWNDLSEFYACEHFDVSSHDGVVVPLTIVYSHKKKPPNSKPGILHGYGAYGELLDKRWRSELKSLLDRGWVVAYADVRGGGGGGKKWHHDGRRTKKLNSIKDYIACAEFLLEKDIVSKNKLAGRGYCAGGLLVASAINTRPDLFRAAILEVPFLDPCNTLLYPILPFTRIEYEEFGHPKELDDFEAIRKYSPYDTIQNDTLYPAIFVTSSFNTRFGMWEATKWVARARDHVIHDPERPILLNLNTDDMEENKYLQCEEAALQTAFLIKMVMDF